MFRVMQMTYSDTDARNTERREKRPNIRIITQKQSTTNKQIGDVTHTHTLTAAMVERTSPNCNVLSYSQHDFSNEK